MKYIVHISRIFVGVLFIISGLIKLNDPLGFSYKLQEYFSTDVLNIPFLEPYALIISVFVVVLEVVLGVFLLIGYKPKFTVWSLLGMIVFFTFLTFYSAYFDKVKDCGCFGDALKLTPWESFTKDVVLLVFILILFFGIKHIKPLFAKLPTTTIALLSFLLSLWFGYHVLMHLPAKDFRAYAIGKNIQQQMLVPDDAPKPVVEYIWKFKVNGEEKEFVTNGTYPTVEGGEYVDVTTKEIDPGYIPPIQDFTIESTDEDFTTYFLEKENLVIIAMYNVLSAEPDGLAKLKTFSDDAIKKGYTVIGLSASGEDAKQQLKTEYNLNFDIYLCDEKVVKTVVRANPGIVILEKGTVINKAHWNDIEDINLEILPNANMELNLDLKNELDEILKTDQGVRQIFVAKTKEEKDAIATGLGLPIKDNDSGYMQLWHEVDSLNLIKVEKIIKEYGYPSKTMVGEPSNEAVWYVIQHSNKEKNEQYFPLIKEAGKKGDISMSAVAMMEDRLLMYQGKPQIYGTQGRTLGMNTETPIDIIWPIENPEKVNELRQDVGFPNTVQESAESMLGENYVFKFYTLDEVKKLENELKRN